MAKTTDKIILGVLVILLIGMGGVFITAVSNQGENQVPLNKQLLVTDTTSAQTNLAAQTNFEENDDEETEVPLTGAPLERASAVALAYIGEGRVTDSEIGDEESYYEIEITLNNGGEVDVHLDENFKVLGVEYENEEDDDD